MFGREVVVRSVDEEVQNQLERLSLGLPPVENRSVSSVANVISFQQETSSTYRGETAFAMVAACKDIHKCLRAY